MKKSILILGFALAAPIALLAQGPRKGGGPGGPPHGPGGPGGPDGGPGEVHDDPHRNPMFHALLRAIDTDGDGIISMSEMNHAAESLLALDKNGDGKLTPNELMPRGHDHHDGPPPPPPKGDKGDKGDKPGKPDADKDGNPKPAVDKDGNPLPDGDKGDDQKPRKGHKPPGDGDNGNPPPPREDEQRSALVDAIDTNHDGIISADEIAAARANLKKLDLNHDGKLEPHEYGRPHHKD